MVELNEKAKKVFALKYSTRKTKSWKETCRNIADLIAEGEKPYGKTDEQIKEIADIFYNMLLELDILPGGRIIANAGTGIKNLANCFVLGIEDSRQSIYQTLKDAAEIFAMGGGVGYDFSKIREEGADIKSTGGKASGALSFMSLFDQTGEVIQQASRRGAQLGTMNISSPDIENFINFKSVLNSRNRRLIQEYDRNLHLVDGRLNGTRYEQILEKTLLDDQLTHFNISVLLTNKFMQQVEKDGNWDLISPVSGSIIKTVKAKNLLYQMAKQAHASGDPGQLFFNRINQDNMVAYIGDITASNPCLYKETILLDKNNLSTISNCSFLSSWKSGIKECILLKTNAGHEIIVTPDHQIMLENEDFIKAKDSINKNIKWGLGQQYIQNIIDKFVLLGFLFGDGFLCGNKFGISVKLNIDKEPEVTQLLQQFEFHQQKNGAFYINKKSLEEKIKISLDFMNSPVWNREIPKEILYANTDIIASFVKGLFEANGSTTKSNSQISLKSTNKNTSKLIQIILASFNIPSWIVTNKPNTIKWKNGIYTSRESYNLQIAPRNANIFKQNIGFLSDKKNNKIKIFLKKYSQKLKIVSIEEFGKQEVWDFNANNGYSFANGIIAHNCGEVPLLEGESCILASINLHEMFDKKLKQINYEKLKITTKTITRFLEDVTEITEAPLEYINKISKALRRLGIGVLGFADLLVELNIPYESSEAIKLSEYLSWFINFHAWETSFKLAKERGHFKYYNKNKVNLFVVTKVLYDSPFEKSNIPIKKLYKIGLRNVSVTSIAPTGSIAIIGGVNGGIEPFFALAYKRNITEGVGNIATDSIFEINPALEGKLKDAGYDKNKIEEILNYVISRGSLIGCKLVSKELQELFKTANDIEWKTHIDIQAAWQKYISNAISKTSNISEKSTIDDIFNMYMYMWKKGLKGGTIYRNNSKSFQILEKP